MGSDRQWVNSGLRRPTPPEWRTVSRMIRTFILLEVLVVAAAALVWMLFR